MQVQELDRAIAAKERELQAVQGRETEIYTRIVGYYRSLKNWNRGKKEEFRLRKTYDVMGPDVRSPLAHFPANATTDTAPTGASAAAAAVAAPTARGSFAPDRDVHAYRYFYSPTCSGCRAMRAALDEVLLPGQAFNVADESGYAQAVADEILSTPQVVALSSAGVELWRTGDPREAAARFGVLAQTC